MGMASFRRIDVYRDDANPNVYWIEPDATRVLVQINHDQYEVRQGRRILGVVVFRDGTDQWGWCYYPRQNGHRPSRVLHPNPEAALIGRRIAITDVITLIRRGRVA